MIHYIQSKFTIFINSFKKFIQNPLISIVDKLYTNDIHSKHEKQAKDVNNLTCTPSAFLDKTRPEQVKILASDILLLLSNLSLIGGLYYFTYNTLQIPRLNLYDEIVTLIYTYFAIDLTTGLFHFTLDNPATKNHPLITVKNLAWQFQDHHDKPYDNTLPPLLHTLCNFSFATVFPLSLNFLYTYLFHVNMVTYALYSYSLALFSQYVHRSIHYREDQRAKYIIFLMKLKLIQSVENHHKHHKTYDCYYTTLNGWTDPVIHFFKKRISKKVYEETDWFAFTMKWFLFGMPVLYIIIRSWV